MTIQTITEDGEVVQANPAPLTLFGTTDPTAVVERATQVAKALKDVLQSRKLIKRIGNREFVLLEGWSLLGSMLGVFAQIEWTRPVDDGWEARAVVRTMGGSVVGGTEAMCTRREKTWQDRDDYAIRSMAQTRAMAKALRMPLGFIVQLAGYDPTPADEMPTDSEVGLPDIPEKPKPGQISIGQLRQRVVDLADEHAMPLEVLAEVISSTFDRNLGDLSKDELIKLGTDIKQGVYDVPIEPQSDEREGQVGLATGAMTPAADIEVAGQDERDAAGTSPLGVQRDASPATTPAQPTLDDILKVTGGELIDDGATGTAPAGGREAAPTLSGQPSRPTKDAREAVTKARARAEAAK